MKRWMLERPLDSKAGRSMKTWLARLAKATPFAILLVAGLGAWAIWFGNRDVPPVTRPQQQQSYQRAVDWIRANEAQVLKDPNAALWWMLQTAAQRTHDPYLLELVRKSTDSTYVGDRAGLPWKRMLDPTAEVTLNLFNTEALRPYQRFFYHALTCLPVSLDDGDTNRFLAGNACRPQAIQVWLKDPACTTHQLMGVQLFQRMGCPTQENLQALKFTLLSDIDQQMRFDVMVKDTYFQRVLALLWGGDRDRVKPVWLQRVLASQLPDGGWAGHHQIPELPNWLQPWRIKSWLVGGAQPEGIHADFHASAQGLLIMALSMTEPEPIKR
jgi:hypothetical protein